MLSKASAGVPYGRLTMNGVLEDIVHHQPDKIYGWIPRSMSLQDGFKVLTYTDLINAVSAAAHWLDHEFGILPQKPSARETIAFIGLNDLNYPILVLAADRTNRTLLIPLAANITEAQTRLIDGSGAKALLALPSTRHAWDAVIAARPQLKVTEVPDYEHFIAGDSLRYPYTQPRDEFWHSAPFAIQTSGTTGFPRPINWSNSAISTIDTPDSDYNYGPRAWKDRTTVVPLPQSWLLGLHLGCMSPLFAGSIPAFLPTSVPLPPSYETLKLAKQLLPDIEASVLIPNVLASMNADPVGAEFIRSFKLLAFGGAPLNKSVGDALVKHTDVQGIMGSTEAGAIPRHPVADPADWEYYHIDTSFDWALEPFADGLFELCVHKDENHLRPIFSMQPELEVYRTTDLFEQHSDPAKKHLYKPVGRADDFVKLHGMCKFNAVSIEGALNASPTITLSVVGGVNKPTSFAILQPAESHSSPAAAIEAMWPAIEAVNATIFKDARLQKDKLIIADPSKPLGTTQKGTTSRRAVISAYETEIEALFK